MRAPRYRRARAPSATELRRVTHRPRSSASRSRAAIAAVAARILVQHRRQHRLVGNQRGVRRVEQMARHGIGRRGEGIERIDALRDLGDAAMAVRQHAGDPARIGEPAAHDARDLLGDAARLGRLGLAGVEMIELGRRCPASPPRRRSRRRNRRRRRRRAGRARGRPADAPAASAAETLARKSSPAARCTSAAAIGMRHGRRDRPRRARRASARRRRARRRPACAP